MGVITKTKAQKLLDEWIVCREECEGKPEGNKGCPQCKFRKMALLLVNTHSETETPSAICVCDMLEKVFLPENIEKLNNK